MQYYGKIMNKNDVLYNILSYVLLLLLLLLLLLSKKVVANLDRNSRKCLNDMVEECLKMSSKSVAHLQQGTNQDQLLEQNLFASNGETVIFHLIFIYCQHRLIATLLIATIN